LGHLHVPGEIANNDYAKLCGVKEVYYGICASREYFPHRRVWNFLGGGGFCKTKKFKEMSEALVEFSIGVGGGGFLRKNPIHGKVWIFSGTTQCSLC